MDLESQFRVEPSTQTSAGYGRPHELNDSCNVENLSSMESFSDEPSESLSKKAHLHGQMNNDVFGIGTIVMHWRMDSS